MSTTAKDLERDYQKRKAEVTGVIAKGAADKAWSTYWEVDYGLVWDHSRECWMDGDGYRYDGSGFGSGSRRPTHAA
jgi:hypothetical protein